MLWSKQLFYLRCATDWLDEHGANHCHRSRNSPEFELVPHVQRDIISMPDKWEYPWYAAWDLAFHVLPL